MSDHRTNHEDNLSSHEDQAVVDIINQETEADRIYKSHSHEYNQRIYTQFQTVAAQLTCLYNAAVANTRERYPEREALLWNTFSAAATTLTQHHKACQDAMKALPEAAADRAYRRRDRETCHWATGRKRHLRREDLLAHLSGRPPPDLASGRVVKSASMAQSSRSSPRPSFRRRRLSPSPRLNQQESLQMFAEAVGGLGDISRLKRPLPSPPRDGGDVVMGSPQHKKARYM